MTKQFRDNLILIIALIIFIVGMFITDHLFWLLLIIFGPALLITWALNKYKPLKNKPTIAWWQELLWQTFYLILFLVAYQIKFSETIFSWQTLSLFIIGLLSAALGILHRHS